MSLRVLPKRQAVIRLAALAHPRPSNHSQLPKTIHRQASHQKPASCTAVFAFGSRAGLPNSIHQEQPSQPVLNDQQTPPSKVHLFQLSDPITF